MSWMPQMTLHLPLLFLVSQIIETELMTWAWKAKNYHLEELTYKLYYLPTNYVYIVKNKLLTEIMLRKEILVNTCSLVTWLLFLIFIIWLEHI